MHNQELAFGEVHFYFQLSIHDTTHTLALTSLFGPPDPFLLAASSSTVWSCKALGDAGLVVVDVSQILSVVSMNPHRPKIPGSEVEGRFFVHEKIGLEVANMGGHQQPIIDEE